MEEKPNNYATVIDKDYRSLGVYKF